MKGTLLMLTEQEKTEIDHEIAKFPHKRHACLDALLIVQDRRGYISDETLKSVAEYLEMSATELDGIATFYNLIYRKPVGKYVIRLCDSVSCFIMGYENIRQNIKDNLSIDWGQTTLDGNFTLLKAQCLGTCDKAPAMMVNNDTHENLTPNRVKEILLAYKEGSYGALSTDSKHAQRQQSAESDGVPSRTRV